jgi:SAM-dependent methyltransferase
VPASPPQQTDRPSPRRNTPHDHLFIFHVACPACAGTDYRVVRTEPVNVEGFDDRERAFLQPYKDSGPIEFRRCLACGFIFLDRLPASSDYYEYLYSRVRYDWDYEFQWHGKKRIFAAIRRQLLRYKRSGRLLDMGTWCGTLLPALAPDYTVVGLELSDDAAGYARSRGLDVRTGSVEQIGEGEAFDVVTMIDVLEHLPDPRGALRTVHDLLAPDGLVYLKLPNGQAQVRKENLVSRFRSGGAGASFGFIHVNHFDERSLRLLLGSVGFEVLEVGYSAIENYDLGWPEPLPARARKLAHNLFVNASVALFTGLRALGLADVGPHLYVIARKLPA